MKKALLILGFFLGITPLSVMLLLPEYFKISFIFGALGLLIISSVLIEQMIRERKEKKENL